MVETRAVAQSSEPEPQTRPMTGAEIHPFTQDNPNPNPGGPMPTEPNDDAPIPDTLRSYQGGALGIA
jgi:hypothetical protein